MATKNNKTNTAAKTETKATKVAPAKVEEVKVEAVKAEVKEEVKAAPAKKTAEKAPAAKKTAAKKTAEKKVAEKKAELFVQFSGLEFSYDDLLEIVKADYIAQTGKKTISSTKLYLKPEDMTVYYVVNEKFLGSVYLG